MFETLIFYFGGLFSLAILFRANWIARVQNPTDVMETNGFWRGVEKLCGKKIAVILILPLTSYILTLSLWLSLLNPEMSIMLGFFVGLIGMNAIVDTITLRTLEACKTCEFFPQKKEYILRCKSCVKMRKATSWDIFEPLRFVVRQIEKLTKKKRI